MKKLNKNHCHWLGNTLKFGVLLLPFSADFGATALGLALLGLWKQKYHQIISKRTNWVLGLLFVSFIITSLLAVQPVLSWEGSGNFLPFLLMVASFPFFFNSFFRLYQLAWWLVLTSIPLCFLGFMQLVAGWETPLFLHSIGVKLIAYGNPDGRMSSLLMYANTLSFYLVVTFTFSMGLWIRHYRRCQPIKNNQINWQLLILTVAILFNGIGLILTNSRTAWGLILLGAIAFALYLRWYWILVTVLIVIIAVSWAAWFPFGQDIMREIVPSYFWARLTDDLYDDRYVTALRTTQWAVAWKMMLQRPLLGWGLRNFTPVYQQEMNVWMGHPHNLFLMLLAEVGIIGTLLLSCFVGVILGKAVRLLIDLFQSLNDIRNTQKSIIYKKRQDKILLLFTYLVAFSLCIIFNLFDVSIFDLRVNLIGWLILSAIAGITARFHEFSRSYSNQ